MSINAGTVNSSMGMDIKGFRSSLKMAKGELKDFKSNAEKMGSSLDKVGGKMQGVGKKMSLGVTMPLVGAGGAAIKTAADFESGMSEVEAISGATGESLQTLEDQAIKLGSTTAFSAKEAAEGMKYLAMAGFDTQQMTQAMPGLLDLAAASGTDLGQTADIVSDSLTAFGLTAEDTGKFADVLAVASSKANVSVETLGETFKYAAPVAGALKFSMEDVTAAAAAMGNAGIKGSQAGTTLRTMMTKIGTSADEAGNSFEQMGVKLKNEDGTMRDLQGILLDTQSAFSTMTESEKAFYAKEIFGAQAMSGALAIMNDKTGALENLSEEFDNAEGAAGNMAETMLDNLNGSLTKLKSALEGAAISIGSTLAPTIKQFAETINGLLDRFNALDQGTKETIVKFLVMAAALGPILFIGGKVVSLVGTLFTAFGAISGAISGAAAAAGGMAGGAGALGTAFTILTGPVGIVIGILAALGVAIKLLYDKNEEFREGIQEIWGQVKDIFATSIELLKAIFSGFIELIMDIFSVFSAAFTGDWETFWAAVTNLFTNFSENWEKIAGLLTDLIMGIFTAFGNALKLFFETLWTGIKNLFNIFATGLKLAVTTVFTAIKTKIVQIWTDIKTKTGQKFDEIKEMVPRKVNEMKVAAMKKFNEFKTSVMELGGKIKKSLSDMFDIKLPHFSLKMGTKTVLGKEISYPKGFGVKWYDKGGIFNSPSVIGVGEKRPEFVGALDDLRKIVGDEFRKISMSSFSGAGATGGPQFNFDIKELIVREEGDLDKVAQKIYDKVDSKLSQTTDIVMNTIRKEART